MGGRLRGYRKDLRNGWKASAAARMPRCCWRFMEMGTRLLWGAWKDRGWDFLVTRRFMLMHGRSRILNILCRRMAWETWNEYWTRLARGARRKLPCMMCCIAIT